MYQCSIRAKRYVTRMGKKPTESRLDAIDEQDGPLDVVEGEVQSVKSEMQRGFDLVRESLQRILTLERGLDAMMVKLDKLLSQQGERSNNVRMDLGQEKHAMEVSGSWMESEMTQSRREWVQAENMQQWDNRVQ